MTSFPRRLSCPQVRVEAFEVLVSMAEMLPSDVCKAFVLPVLRRHMQPFESDTTMQHSVAAAFGRIVKAIKGCMEADDGNLLQGFFRHLAQRGDPTIRLLCAQQLPDVLRWSTMYTPASPQFHDVMMSLASDSSEEVRRATAESVNEVRCRQCSPRHDVEMKYF